jgi:alkaline phosphatase
MTVETTKAARNTAVTQEPSLPEMTRAISLLDGRTERGLLLQVEGALIDKRSHANDATPRLGEMKAYDDAARVAFDYAARRPHPGLRHRRPRTRSFNISEPGSFTNAEALDLPGTGNVDSSNPANVSSPRRAGRQQKDPGRSTVRNNASGSTAGNFAPATFGTPDDPADVRDGDPRASLWLSYLSGNHTGADVPLHARGPESGRFAGHAGQHRPAAGWARTPRRPPEGAVRHSADRLGVEVGAGELPVGPGDRPVDVPRTEVTDLSWPLRRGVPHHVGATRSRRTR